MNLLRSLFVIAVASSLPVTAQSFVETYGLVVASPGPSLPWPMTAAFDVGGNRVIGLDLAGTTLVWNTSGTANSWSALSTSGTAPGAGTPLVTRGTGSAARVFAFDGGTALTHEFAGSAWSVLSPTQSPPARGGFAIAGAPDGRVFLFGGILNNTLFKDTWVFNPTTGSWQQVFPTTSPSARRGAAMAVRGGLAVLFGGDNLSATFGDTWKFDGTSWAQYSLSASPSVRSFASLTLQERDNRLILADGFSLAPGLFAETWAFTANDTWTALATTTPTATMIGATNAAYDRVHDETIVVDMMGDTFVAGVFQARAYGSAGAPTCVCTGQTFPMGILFGGQARPGSTFSLNFPRPSPNGVLVFFGAGEQNPPAALPFNGCNQLISGVAGSVFTNAPAVAPSINVSVPNSVSLIGTRLFYQGLGFNDGCASSAMEVRVGR